MGIILIKLNTGDPDAFKKAVGRAAFWYGGLFGMSIISKYPNGSTITSSRGKYSRHELKSVLFKTKIRVEDRVVVTILDKGDPYADTYSGNIYGPQISFIHNYGRLYPSLHGETFITAADDFPDFKSSLHEGSLLKYSKEFFTSDIVKDYVKCGDFEKIININKDIHRGLQIVYGNRNGIYIHNPHLFYRAEGILVSDMNRGPKILSFLNETKLDKKIDAPIPKANHIGYRSGTFRQREYLKAINDLIYYIYDDEYYNKGIPFRDKEKFVVIKENSYPYLDLLSLKTGEKLGIVLYTLLHSYTPFKIKNLHDE